MNAVYNFSAGPAMLPQEVLSKAKKELKNWNQLGLSVMEISHRSEEFIQIALEAEKDLRDLLNIPESYKILFCQGGARGQFSAVPMNLSNNIKSADYINSGYWSQCAEKEAKKYCSVKSINIKKKNNNNISLLPCSEWNISKLSEYIHYCPNETMHGIAIHEEPVFNKKIIIGDFSSVILSRCINITNYDLIYAGAQKNIGPAGMTIIIIKEKLLHHSNVITPSILNYKILSTYNSMYNTPPTFSWYLSGLVFKWLKKQGGIKKIEQKNEIKSNLLYKTIDHSNFYTNNIDKNNRSKMNIVFNLIDEKLNDLFLRKAHEHGLFFLKGHSLVGGMRASIYNAMPILGVKNLVKFMLYFEKKYG
ncbi:3-phosphoserine/phosphohydroxythreonine transaminase [Buchnera aphidicola]|uniref:3-phosphoserine/phosphohydroxythreonine transaminase n=1 Tax=Buchnera aphidicola TaxID=9 RepID=UPI003BEEE8DB